ncbi:hypothetical protein Thiowin_02799 [Thiorhodovibrio winogradskyi]|uniref:Uncharacterized protein n=1 Tax=Thiorhodovibrio winogradskyi TaxID=77007 RepID=A0ABZ0SB29_9GAMM
MIDYTQFDYSILFIAVLVIGYGIYALIRGEFQWNFTTAKRIERPVSFWLSIAFSFIGGGLMLMLGMNICPC